MNELIVSFNREMSVPELPEVETIVRDLQKHHLIGNKIIAAAVFWPRSIQPPSVEEFSTKICGQKIVQISRRGKYIVFTLEDYTLLVHLRMTGKLILSGSEPECPIKHERLRLKLSNGMIMHYADQRKFGRWSLTSHQAANFDRLGLEPLSENFTLAAFQSLISKRTTMLKPFLLNQAYVVGLGNIYVDEALWEAKLHPGRKVNSLTAQEIKRLYRAIPLVLKQGVENMGTSLGSHDANYYSVSRRRGLHQHDLKVFRRDGLPCPRCHTPIVKIILAQRGTHLCPHCQPEL